jgi:putative transposase
VSRYIDEHRDRFGVEPICHAVQVAPSTYYAARRRPPSARAVRDAELAPKVLQVFNDNYRVYGVRKLWRQLQRQGEQVGRDQVGRLMHRLGIAGVVRGTTRRTTTVADPAAVRAPDLVNRQFVATRPNQLWVSDFTHVATWSGTSYVAFVIDVYSRLIVGWRAAATMRTELVLDALEMAVWRRADVLDGLVCHSDAGSQYTSIRYTDRLADIGAAPSIGTVGDSYDNSLAESTIGLFKTELIRRHGPWRTVDDVELAALGWIDWYNTRRLHSELGHVPPAEHEAAYYTNQEATTAA